MHSVCESIAAAKQKNKADKVPYGYYHSVIDDMRDEVHWITIDILKKVFKKYEAEKKLDCPVSDVEARACLGALSLQRQCARTRF